MMSLITETSRGYPSSTAQEKFILMLLNTPEVEAQKSLMIETLLKFTVKDRKSILNECVRHYFAGYFTNHTIYIDGDESEEYKRRIQLNIANRLIVHIYQEQGEIFTIPPANFSVRHSILKQIQSIFCFCKSR